ncbi:MAG TPA: histidinol-phosphatase [Planctomycetota bacterium]
MRGLFLLSLTAALGLLLFVPVPLPWWKGNTHTHTLWSDGDGAPEFVADAYKTRGYHFLMISDHNVQLAGERWVKTGRKKGEISEEHLDQLIARYGEAVDVRPVAGGREMRLKTFEDIRARFQDRSFILIQGEELSASINKLPLHHNSMNHEHPIEPAVGTSMREAMAYTVEAVEAASKKYWKPMLVHLNHPNFHWAVTPDDVAHVLGERYFEIYNGHRGVRNYGDAQHLGTEALWDYVLALRLSKLGGDVLYGLATDDAHNYHKPNQVSLPGRGWIWVRAAALTANEIVRAMKAGDFYASSGVRLRDVIATSGSLHVRVAAEPGVRYETRFIGAIQGGPLEGVTLATVPGTSADYVFTGAELYVRAVVVSDRRHPDGYEPNDLESAWTQPVRLR